MRTALTQAQTRCGGKEKPLEEIAKIVGKGKPAIISSLDPKDYGKLIAACAALS